MAALALKGTLAALLGNGWKSVSLGLLLAVVGLSMYSCALKRETIPHDLQRQLRESNKFVQATAHEAQSTTARARKSTEKLNHVLESNKDWSEQHVPAAIVDELCRKIRCDEDASSVRAPSSKPHHFKGSSKRTE